MPSPQILHEDSLTDNEEDYEGNVYKFISTRAQQKKNGKYINSRLRKYIRDIGWNTRSDIEFVDTNMFQQIYNKLNKKDKLQMKTFLDDIRDITGDRDFDFVDNVGGKNRRTKRLRKTKHKHTSKNK